MDQGMQQLPGALDDWNCKESKADTGDAIPEAAVHDDVE